MTGESNQHIHSLTTAHTFIVNYKYLLGLNSATIIGAITTCNHVIHLKSQASSILHLGLNNQNVHKLTLGSQQSILLELTNDYPRQWNYKSLIHEFPNYVSGLYPLAFVESHFTCYLGTFLGDIQVHSWTCTSADTAGFGGELQTLLHVMEAVRCPAQMPFRGRRTHPSAAVTRGC